MIAQLLKKWLEGRGWVAICPDWPSSRSLIILLNDEPAYSIIVHGDIINILTRESSRNGRVWLYDPSIDSYWVWRMAFYLGDPELFKSLSRFLDRELGMWESLGIRSVRDRETARSNRAIPTVCVLK